MMIFTNLKHKIHLFSLQQINYLNQTFVLISEGYPEGYPYDVTVSRLENEGFGFVIISSVSRAGSTIGRIIPGINLDLFVRIVSQNRFGYPTGFCSNKNIFIFI